MTSEADTGSSEYSVLLVEDSATNRLLITKVLEKSGCLIACATTGLEAVASLTGPGRDAFDVVLMDIHMPGMDGLEACRLVRVHEAAHPTLRRMPIVALTADDAPHQIARTLAAGMDAHILKPIDWPRLLATIMALANASAD